MATQNDPEFGEFLDTIATKGKQRAEPGPVGRRVPGEIRALRQEADMSTYQLADVLDGIGWPRLRAAAISKIETGRRALSVDDLVAIATALDVSPLRIMLGDPDRPPDEPVALTPAVSRSRARAWADWANDALPLSTVQGVLSNALATAQRDLRRIQDAIADERGRDHGKRQEE